MTKSEIANKLKKLKSALIFCHARPDGDTLSSAFSLKLAFKKLGIRSDVVCQDKIPAKYASSKFIGEFDEPKFPYDAHISVDCANEGMIGSLYDDYKKNANSFNIDHHVSNSRYAKENYVAGECSNSINIYDIIKEMGVIIDAEMANTIYLGICTDSGNFSQTNADGRSFLVASELVGLGAVPYEIYNSMFKNQSVERARLYARVISGMKFYHDNKLAIITIREKDLKDFGVDSSVTEGFIDFPLTVGSVMVAISVLEKDEKHFKLSFRSKNPINVNEIAGTFGGGGHVNASGAMLNGFYEDVIDKLVWTVGNYL